MAGSNLIVVGVDGSELSRKALRWAIEEAHCRTDHVLVVVSTWAMEQPAGFQLSLAGSLWGYDADLGPATQALLDELVADVATEFPNVEITKRVVAGRAAQVLINLSEGAALVVVGSRGHGGFSGMLLGSVSQHVLAHSQCSVVVVR